MKNILEKAWCVRVGLRVVDEFEDDPKENVAVVIGQR